MTHVGPLIDRLTEENFTIKQLIFKLLTDDDKPIDQQIEQAKTKGTSN